MILAENKRPYIRDIDFISNEDLYKVHKSRIAIEKVHKSRIVIKNDNTLNLVRVLNFSVEYNTFMDIIWY